MLYKMTSRSVFEKAGLEKVGEAERFAPLAGWLSCTDHARSAGWVACHGGAWDLDGADVR